MEHLPVEQRPGRAPVSVHKRVVVGEPEVEKDAANDRMNKVPAGFPLAKSHIACKRAGSSFAGGGA